MRTIESFWKEPRNLKVIDIVLRELANIEVWSIRKLYDGVFNISISYKILILLNYDTFIEDNAINIY